MILLRLLIIALFQTAASTADSPSDAEFFEMQVRPLLAERCFACHSTTKLGGLEMSSRQALLEGGDSGPAIEPGRPSESLLIQAVQHRHERLEMPPDGKLPDDEIAVLIQWIEDGAVWPEHPAAPESPSSEIPDEQRSWWSFQPVEKPEPPAVRDAEWAKTPIDRFILARLEDKGLQPAGPADRRTLLRRASFDLIGLPPTPEEVEAFLNDKSPNAFATVVDRLLASAHYGERWGRYWLDIARYSDDRLNSTQDEPTPNRWRYRDWVVQALNDDMPYNDFVKAQLAGDQMEPKERYVAGLGFFTTTPRFEDDRVDALSRGFLGLTVACARCHDHKFDPIPTRDYYSLLGVFESSTESRHPLAPPEVVEAYKAAKEAAGKQAEAVREFEKRQAGEVAAILASQSSRYLAAARQLYDEGASLAASANAAGLDAETLERWIEYLGGERKHPFLDGWQDEAFDDKAFERKLMEVIAEKDRIDQENLIRLGGKTDNRSVRVIEVLSLERDDFVLWDELLGGKGVLVYNGTAVDRFLGPLWKSRIDALRAELERLEAAVPEPYPYLITIEDVAEPEDLRVHVRGDKNNLGEVAPRRFLAVLCDGEPEPFRQGSGRLELAEAIVAEENPLTARVIVNRIWMYHFGEPLVGTPGNFGRLGERPSHPGLLDYLAARLMEEDWSLKALHREIMLTRAYALAAERNLENEQVDADNKLLWRANRRRLSVEALRDALLFVAGRLDPSIGGEPLPLADTDNRRRTIYGSVSRRRLDGTLALFDFPNPVSTSDGRVQTATPLQQLYFLNSDFVQTQSEALAERLDAPQRVADAKIRRAYEILFQREPSPDEIGLGWDFLAHNGGNWKQYAQALLSLNEFLYVD